MTFFWNCYRIRESECTPTWRGFGWSRRKSWRGLCYREVQEWGHSAFIYIRSYFRCLTVDSWTNIIKTARLEISSVGSKTAIISLASLRQWVRPGLPWYSHHCHHRHKCHHMVKIKPLKPKCSICRWPDPQTIKLTWMVNWKPFSIVSK